MSFARVRAVAVVAALSVLALLFVVVTLIRDSQSGDDATAGDCPEGYVRADVRLREPKEIKIKVFNATDSAGLAANVAANFRNRDFQVLAEGTEKQSVDGVALLRYGPRGVGSAHVLRAYFLDQAEPVYDPERKDDVVDVVLGASFRQLATTTEVNQALVELQSPLLPEKTCADKE